MSIKDFIKERTDDFTRLCRDHQVSRLFVFGSSVTGNFDPRSSDIDLLVEVESNDPIVRGELLLDLWDKFESFFGREIDLLTETSLKNPVLKNNIQSSKVLIYDGKGQKVLI